MKLERKKVKELIKEIEQEEMLERVSQIFQENEELKAELELLRPKETIKKEQISYIG